MNKRKDRQAVRKSKGASIKLDLASPS